MIVWLVRHALAVEPDQFPGTDLRRPLTPEGQKRARAMFSHLAKVREAPDVLLTSEAVRARETAAIFAEEFRVNTPTATPRLNPGARFPDIHGLVANVPAETRFVALFGHEPDFSGAARCWTGEGTLDIVLKKCGIIELKVSGGNRPARLRMVLPPDLFV